MEFLKALLLACQMAVLRTECQMEWLLVLVLTKPAQCKGWPAVHLSMELYLRIQWR